MPPIANKPELFLPPEDELLPLVTSGGGNISGVDTRNDQSPA